VTGVQGGDDAVSVAAIRDPRRAAIRHVLTAPAIASRTVSHLREDGIDLAGLEIEQATMSDGEALLVRIAFELWYGEKHVGLPELTRRLDARSFRRVVEALAIARGEAPPDWPSPSALLAA
jgi:hypothetical protein